MRRADLTIVLGVAAIVGLTGRAASAADVVASLDYAAEPICPAAAEFESVVARHLGYSPFRDDASDRLVIRIETSGRILEGRLEWRTEDGRLAGERTFPSRSGDCVELVRAMGFALAVQFQLLATVETPAPPAAVPPTVAQPTVVAPPAPPSASGPPAPPPPLGPALAAGAGASAGVGLGPDPTVLGRVFGIATWSHAALELAAEVSVPSEIRRADGAGFSHQFFLASLAGCGVLSRFSGCVLAKAGAMRVAGDNVDTPTTASGLVIQTGLRLAAAQTLGQRTLLLVHADAVTTLTRGVVTLDAMPVWTTPRVAGTFGVDVAVRFR